MAAMDFPDYSADMLRRTDEDRWLSAQYANPELRARLLALYALHAEIARAPALVSEAALGEIRLQWWRDMLDRARRDASVSDHPAAEAAQAAGVLDDQTTPALMTAIDARSRLFYLDQEPFGTVADLLDWLKAAEGYLAAAAARLAGPVDAAFEEPLFNAAASFALMRQGAELAPHLADAFPSLAGELHEDAAMRLRTLPSQQLPAALHFALTPVYRAGQGRPSPLVKRWRLFMAMARGRL